MSDKFIKFYKYLCIELLFLIALGGAVRAMNAGLACPDWPLCFGDIIPDYHPQVYFEFIHRALAGFIGIVSVVLNIQILRSPKMSKTLKSLALASIVLLLSQVLMGGLTVLLQLHEKVVTLHLALGTCFFAISLWIYLSLKYAHQHYPGTLQSKKAQTANIILLICVYGQILLGGLVASHYAALVCTDFPLCHGQFIPTFSGIIGLHVIHRLGAYALAIVVLVYFFYVQKNVDCAQSKSGAKWILWLLLFQIAVGISNVLFLTPPLITVLHLATGTVLLGAAVRQLRLSSFSN